MNIVKMNYQEDLESAKERQQGLNRVFKKIKKKRPKNLDEVFNAAHQSAFEKIDCLQCANCCKTTSPIFRDVDIRRIAKRLKMAESDFERTYLKKDEDQDWVLKSAPCTFLNEDNTCSIYAYRPQACREYPHTDRKRMIQILDLTERNAIICPAVAQIVTRVTEVFD